MLSGRSTGSMVHPPSGVRSRVELGALRGVDVYILAELVVEGLGAVVEVCVVLVETLVLLVQLLQVSSYNTRDLEL